MLVSPSVIPKQRDGGVPHSLLGRPVKDEKPGLHSRARVFSSGMRGKDYSGEAPSRPGLATALLRPTPSCLRASRGPETGQEGSVPEIRPGLTTHLLTALPACHLASYMRIICRSFLSENQCNLLQCSDTEFHSILLSRE